MIMNCTNTLRGAEKEKRAMEQQTGGTCSAEKSLAKQISSISVSIIVSVYNTEPYLRQCLDSLTRQTLQELEIICVDDGSTDGSSDILDEYAVKHPNIKVIHKENGGVTSARRCGESAARGVYIGYMDSDDWADPEMYQRLYNCAVDYGVELESREEIIYETYAKTINIEALAMIDMAGKQIIPAVMKYSRSLADTINAVKAAGADVSVQTGILKEVSEKLSAMQTALVKLEKAEKEASAIEDAKKQAFFYKDTVKVIMEELRAPADRLEMIVDKEMWPIPTYSELMFEI